MTAAAGNRSASFDHLIGTGKQRRRYFEAERLGSLQVDHPLVLGGSLNQTARARRTRMRILPGPFIGHATMPTCCFYAPCPWGDPMSAHRLNHPSQNLAKNIGVCPPSPPTPSSRAVALF